jgi:hypothetical protein
MKFQIWRVSGRVNISKRARVSLRAGELPNEREALFGRWKIQASERLSARGGKFQIGSRLFAGEGRSKGAVDSGCDVPNEEKAFCGTGELAKWRQTFCG